MWNWRLNRRPSDQGSQNDNVDLVIAYTIDGILSGRCNPGDKVKEADLANGTGLGVGYAREALQLMTGAKILERQQNHGYRVRQLDHKHLAGYMETLELSLALALDMIHKNVWTQQENNTLAKALDLCLTGELTADDATLPCIFEVFDVLMERCGSRYLPQVYLSLCPVLLVNYINQSLDTNNRHEALKKIKMMTNDLIKHLAQQDSSKSLTSIKDIISYLQTCLDHRLPAKSGGDSN